MISQDSVLHGETEAWIICRCLKKSDTDPGTEVEGQFGPFNTCQESKKIWAKEKGKEKNAFYQKWSIFHMLKT